MSYTRRKIEGGVGALRESDDTKFLKPNGQSRNLNIYGSAPSKLNVLSVIYENIWTYLGLCPEESQVDQI